MENFTLNQIQEALNSKNQEIGVIKDEFTKLKESVASFEKRLYGVIGEQPQKDPQKPLRIFVKTVLSNSNEPLTVAEVAELVLEAGYLTASKKNFRNIVQQVLLGDDAFKRATRLKTRPVRYKLEEV